MRGIFAKLPIFGKIAKFTCTQKFPVLQYSLLLGSCLSTGVSIRDNTVHFINITVRYYIIDACYLITKSPLPFLKAGFQCCMKHCFGSRKKVKVEVTDLTKVSQNYLGSFVAIK